MPSLGADMEAGTLVEWLKKPGDAVKRGDVVAVVETQKGAIEIENRDLRGGRARPDPRAAG
jgi:pyruvate dehydrogenase E2 component (dihydrolipoamide acetyltransferase)